MGTRLPLRMQIKLPRWRAKGFEVPGLLDLWVFRRITGFNPSGEAGCRHYSLLIIHYELKKRRL
ncbi:MAG: hypothetical protein IIZ49_02875 [Oscillospiraceae bacterium]|nr:hypothetical protein [Oscillospiraceae bacterium]